MSGKRLLSLFSGIFLIVLGVFFASGILSYILSDQQTSLGGVTGDFLVNHGLILLGWVSMWVPIALIVFGVKTLAWNKKRHWGRISAGLILSFLATLILLALPYLGKEEVTWSPTGASSGALGWLFTRWAHEKIGWAGILSAVGFCLLGAAIFLGGERLMSTLEKYKLRTVNTLVSLARSVCSWPGRVYANLKDKLGNMKLEPGKKKPKLKQNPSMPEQKAQPANPEMTNEEKLQPAFNPTKNQQSPAAVPSGPESDTMGEEIGNTEKDKKPEIIMPKKNDNQLLPDQSFQKRGGQENSDYDYQLPPVQILHAGEDSQGNGEEEETIRKRGEILEQTLQEFKIDAEVVRVQRGPVVTMYEMALAPGTKVSKVESLDDDLAIALKAPNVRIVAPLPGKSTIGIEVPNSQRETVTLRELFSETAKDAQHMDIPLFLGKDTAGTPLMVDLAMAPHLLIAGATGSGKSVSINSIICSIILTRTPYEVQLLLVDPKSVEFADYQTIPHLITPVVTDMKKAAGVLQWACKKMDERYALLSRVGVRNIGQYNRLGKEKIIQKLDPEDDAEIDDVPFHMAHTVIIIDELGEMMLVAAKEVESSIIRLSQKARAVGIHLICATQRPSADVITGLIKANLPVKIAFQVSSKINSRVILDRNGAELLLGQGDMLVIPPGSSRLMRAQGTFVSQAEAVDIVNFVAAQQEPQFKEELQSFTPGGDDDRSQEDELYEDAVRIVLDSQRGSVSLLQRRLAIGYSRAARLIDMIADAGLIGPYKGSQAREVKMTLEEWETAKNGQ